MVVPKWEDFAAYPKLQANDGGAMKKQNTNDGKSSQSSHVDDGCTNGNAQAFWPRR
jgi:hypothetical protein